MKHANRVNKQKQVQGLFARAGERELHTAACLRGRKRALAGILIECESANASVSELQPWSRSHAPAIRRLPRDRESI